MMRKCANGCLSGTSAAMAFMTAVLGCANQDPASDGELSTAEVHQAYSWQGAEYSATADDSGAPVHVAVTVCETTEAATEHTLDCPAHSGYALVGGGARAFWTDGTGALIRESYPVDGYYWRGSSQDYLTEGQHYLRVYAIGLRLDGYPVKHLRQRIEIWSGHGDTFDLAQSFPGQYVLSGGFSVEPDRFMKASKGIGGNGWSVTGTNHLQNLPQGVTLYVMKMPGGILEGFGALEVAQRSGAMETTFSGIDRAMGTPRAGWSVVGLGGETRTFFGSGRLLSGIGMADAREVEVFSKDHGAPSSGTTQAYFTEVRKLPGSHGLCNPGTKLASAMDSCVASICAVDPHCCQTSWDSTCVAQVESLCGRDCSDYACSTPSRDTAWWEVNHKGDCYAYALNTTNFPPLDKDPGVSYWYGHWNTPAMLGFAVIGDGLLPSNATDLCPDNRTKVAAVYDTDGSGFGGYHWLRQDTDTSWSHSYGYDNHDSLGNEIWHPEDAIWTNGYDSVTGYYCTCSDAEQGQGHVDLGRWPEEDPWNPTMPPDGRYNAVVESYPMLIADAGPDLSVALPGSAALDGSVHWQEPHGVAAPEVTISWSKKSGPGTVTFADPNSATTSASFSQAGVYLLRLKAAAPDTAPDVFAYFVASTFDEVEVTVEAASPCAGLCDSPTVFSYTGSYQAGNLGTGTVCRETSSVVHGGNCGNFAGGRKLWVNGVQQTCDYLNWASLPPPRSGGYCVQTSAGDYPWAYFVLWQ